MMKMAKADETVKFKNYTRKVKSALIIYADFQSTLIPKNNGRQNPDQFHASKYQNHVGWSYIYKLVCVDDQFSNPSSHF